MTTPPTVAASSRQGTSTAIRGPSGRLGSVTVLRAWPAGASADGPAHCTAPARTRPLRQRARRYRDRVRPSPTTTCLSVLVAAVLGTTLFRSQGVPWTYRSDNRSGRPLGCRRPTRGEPAAVSRNHRGTGSYGCPQVACGRAHWGRSDGSCPGRGLRQPGRRTDRRPTGRRVDHDLRR